MWRRDFRIVGVALVSLLVFVGAAAPPSVVEQWNASASIQAEFEKLLIVGITDDGEARRRFEDKFVSHLRGRNIEAVTSYSIVPDLQTIDDRQRVIDSVMRQEIDGVLTLRIVPLDEPDETAWSNAWTEAQQAEGTVRELIEETLPIEATDAKRFGVEVALWGTLERSRIWAGRSAGHKRKQLKKGAGEFVQQVIDALKDARRL